MTNTWTAARAAAIFAALSCSVTSMATAAEDFKLPKEVTPAIRAACETDVRRLCVGSKPTLDKVMVCVAEKFTQLPRKCQTELASAGFTP